MAPDGGAEVAGAENGKIEKLILEKPNNLGFRPGPVQTGLYSHRRLEA